MRKSPDIPEKKCEQCGTTYKPKGTAQRFCSSCAEKRDKTRKAVWYRKNFPNAKPKEKCNEVCCVCGGTFSGWFDGRPYCNKHWIRMYKNGTIEPKKRKRTCVYEIDEDTLRITTKRGEVILADASDAEMLGKYSWCIAPTGYPTAMIEGKATRMHRYILGLKKEDKIMVDHIDGNPLNNRRSNLRRCTNTENCRNIKVQKNNTSGYTGVRINKCGTYSARIMVNRKEISAGTYANLADAVKARKLAEKEFFREFAPSNSRIEQMSDAQNQTLNLRKDV